MRGTQRGGDAGAGGPFEGEGVGAIGDDVRDGGVDATGGAGVDHRLQVAARAGRQDDDAPTVGVHVVHPAKLGGGGPTRQRPNGEKLRQRGRPDQGCLGCWPPGPA